MGRGRTRKIVGGGGRGRRDLSINTYIQEIISRAESGIPSRGAARVRSQTKSETQSAPQLEPSSTV